MNKFGIKTKGPFGRFLLKHRTELIMWALIGEMLASPAADYHPRVGAGLAILVLIFLLMSASYMASRKLVRIVVFPIAGLWLIARGLEAFCDSRLAYAHLAPIAGLALEGTPPYGPFV